MAIDERQRHSLHARLDEVLGPDDAAVMMSLLPPVGWADVATKGDLDHLRTSLANEFRAELHRELHREVGGLRTEVHREIGGLRAEMHREIGGLRDQLLANHRQLVFAIIASQFTAVSLAFAAASL